MALLDEKLPIKMLNDRLLVQIPRDGRRAAVAGGILIPATAQISKRLVWAEVVAVGPNVRTVEVGDQVLFSPEDRYEVEVRGEDYIILRERDIHAVAANRIEAAAPACTSDREFTGLATAAGRSMSPCRPAPPSPPPPSSSPR